MLNKIIHQPRYIFQLDNYEQFVITCVIVGLKKIWHVLQMNKYALN